MLTASHISGRLILKPLALGKEAKGRDENMDINHLLSYLPTLECLPDESLEFVISDL